MSLALAAAADPCVGTTTEQINACLVSHLQEADAVLNSYFDAALRRVRSETAGATTAKRLVKAERAWVEYRNAECDSVLDYWRGGTIRGAMELNCRIRLTKLRTYAIWRNWLTYPDSTPPVLPSPDLKDVTLSH